MKCTQSMLVRRVNNEVQKVERPNRMVVVAETSIECLNSNMHPMALTQYDYKNRSPPYGFASTSCRKSRSQSQIHRQRWAMRRKRPILLKALMVLLGNTRMLRHAHCLHRHFPPLPFHVNVFVSSLHSTQLVTLSTFLHATRSMQRIDAIFHLPCSIPNMHDCWARWLARCKKMHNNSRPRLSSATS